MELIERILSGIESEKKPKSRPFVTLSYAQSIDGSIAIRRGEQLIISGDAAARLTHQLRAYHDGILVGIGTVLADDPQLTVRLVEGENPQPIVLDSQLRIPLDAKLLKARAPWIATSNKADPARVAEFKKRGVNMLNLPLDADGRLSLPELLFSLDRQGIKTLMVEGGAGVITSFLTSHQVDLVVLTIAPIFVGGLRAINAQLTGRGSDSPGDLVKIRDMAYAEAGEDLVIWGRPGWPDQKEV